MRGVDQDVAGQNSVDECSVRQIVALVVGRDGTEIGVGVANVAGGRVAALDVDRWGSGTSGDNGRRDQVVAAVFLYRKRQKLKKLRFR